MIDIRIEKLASLIVNYSVAVRADDKVVIIGDTIAEPLLKALYAQVLRMGGHPNIIAELPGLDELFSGMLLLIS